jgi:hypothetical protein
MTYPNQPPSNYPEPNRTIPIQPAPTRTSPVWPRYLIIGLVIGGLWIAHRDEPLWEHAARTLLILLIVPPILHVVLSRLRARRGVRANPSGMRLSLIRLVSFKACLLVIGLGIEALIQPAVPNADLITAVFLVISVTVFGTMLHPHFLVPDTGHQHPSRATR